MDFGYINLVNMTIVQAEPRELDCLALWGEPQKYVPRLRYHFGFRLRNVVLQESTNMVYKAINGQAPTYLSSLFNSTSALTNRMLRNSNLNLRPPRMKTKFGQNSFAYRGGGKLRFGTHCLITVENLVPFQLLKGS